MSHQELAADLRIALKAAPNYSARAGQAIVGNLGRGGDGRFARAGGPLPTNPNVGRPKKPKAGKKGAAPKPTEAEQAAALSGAGVPDADALLKFSQGGDLDSATTARLATAGLVEIGSDGKPRMAPNARGLLAAARRGDDRGIKDALSKTADRNSRTADREIKRQERDAARNERKAAADAKRAEREKARAAKSESSARASQERAAAREKSRAAAMDRRIGNQVEEINAQYDASDGGLSEPQTVRATNRLEDSLAELETLALPDDRKAKLRADIQQTLDKLNGVGGSGGPDAAGGTPAGPEKSTGTPDARTKELTGEMRGLLTVKQNDAGVWRWTVVSSNAFKDREDEIVSAAALAADADRMDAAKEFGPLRWWHVGDIEYGTPLDWTTAKAGPGLDIGDCDFVATHGRMMIEGGTFKNADIAAAIAPIADQLQVSRGFTHPMDEPQAGVYRHIKGIERSLLPAGRAANALTALAISKGTETTMATLKEKWDEFVSRAFSGDEAKAQAFAVDVTKKEQDAAAAGVAFKEGDAPAADVPAAVEQALEADKADGDGEGEDAGGDMPFVGDMTMDELVGALAPALAKAIAAAMAPTQAELTETKAALDATQKELSALKGVTVKETGDVAALAARVQTLEGDAPRGAYVPSRDNPAKKKEDLGIRQPAPKSEIDAVVDLMFANTTAA